MKPKRSKSKSRLHSQRKSHNFKEVQQTPNHLKGRLCPINLNEEKEKFMTLGITPQFKLKESVDDLDRATNTKRGRIHFDLFDHAKTILEMVQKKYGDDEQYYNVAYGKPIDHYEASKILEEYLNENNVAGKMTVYWAADLTASARMVWRGPSQKYNRPEARKYSLIIKSTKNSFLREHGIGCLADHEIGTHFFRMMNDGFQPWFSERKKFGLRRLKTREHVASEEGLACLNTIINAKSKYLYRAALVYYTACKAASMTFKELYDHLATYVLDRESRWKHVMRVKRGLPDPGAHGGCGNDQCYFEGAVEILKNIDNIDFHVMYSGSVCVDEVNRIKRLARLDCIHIPKFLKDVEKYRKTLRHIAYLNQIIPKPELPKETARRGSTPSNTIPRHSARDVSYPTPSPDMSKTSLRLTLHQRYLQDCKSNKYASVSVDQQSNSSLSHKQSTCERSDHKYSFGLLSLESDESEESESDSDEDSLHDYVSDSHASMSQFGQMAIGSSAHSCNDQDATYDWSNFGVTSSLPETALHTSSARSSPSRRLLSRPQSFNQSLLTLSNGTKTDPPSTRCQSKK